MYAIYQESDGNLVSTTSLLNFLPLSTGLAYVEVPDVDKRGSWLPGSLTFDTWRKSPLVRRSDFIRKLGLERVAKITLAAKTDNTLAAYMAYVSGLDIINTASTEYTDAMVYLVATGVLTDLDIQEMNE